MSRGVFLFAVLAPDYGRYSSEEQSICPRPLFEGTIGRLSTGEGKTSRRGQPETRQMRTARGDGLYPLP
jgi:hypothetical protein